MKLLYLASRFLESVRIRMQRRWLPRRPLDILRVEAFPSMAFVSCDLLVRGPAAWNPTYSSGAWARLQSQQTLLDALALRRLIFRSFPNARTAQLRIFRTAPSGTHELVLIGNVQRDDGDLSKGATPAIQAKMYGFSFVLSDGALRDMTMEFLPYAS